MTANSHVDEKYLIKTAKEAESVAKKYASLFRKGDVVALFGELGVGKTFFVQNVCKELGIKEVVSSPSYVLLNQYKGDIPIKHYDLYRLQYLEEVFELCMFEDLDETIIFVEWPQIAESILPANTWHFYFEYDNDFKRKLHIIRNLKK